MTKPEIMEHDGKRFERTGLFRIPEPGDYWWSDIDKGVYKCCGRIKNRSASRKREILREIPAEPSNSQPWANRAFEILMALHLSVTDELEPKIKAEIESVVNAFKIPAAPTAQPAIRDTDVCGNCGHGVALHEWEDEVTSSCLARANGSFGTKDAPPCMCPGFKSARTVPAQPVQGEAGLPMLETRIVGIRHVGYIRQAFEKWCMDEMNADPEYLERLTGGRGNYSAHNVQCWWMGWKAAAELARWTPKEGA